MEVDGLPNSTCPSHKPWRIMKTWVRTSTSTVGIVFSGWWKHSWSADGTRMLNERLLRPLGGDVHLSLGFLQSDGCETAGPDAFSAAIRERYSLISPVQIELEQQPNTRMLTKMMLALPHWPNLASGFSEACRFSNETRVYACNLHLMRESGNLFLAPVLGNPMLNVMHQLRAQSRLLRLLASYEAAHGFRYTTVVWARLDAHWLHAHPPIGAISAGAIDVGA